MSSQDIWVLYELSGDTPKRVSLELTQKAHELAAARGEKAAAVIIGENPEEAAKAAFANGADCVIAVKQKTCFEAEAYIMAQLIGKYQPKLVMVPSTPQGRDTAAAISVRCGVGIAVDCTDIRIEGEQIVWERPSYDGRLYAQIRLETDPQIGTLRAGVFKMKEAAKDGAEGEIIYETVDVPASVILTQFLGFRPDADLEKTNIEDADIIVAGGLGFGSKEEFDKLYELAALLGGNVGASRAAVDQGWVSKERQIGITGKTITPKLYIGFGISGAVPHVNGMKNSDVIIAVNSDPNAPIFKHTHYGIVGDLHVIVPALIEKFKEIRG